MDTPKIYTIRKTEEGWMIYQGSVGGRQMWLPLEDFEPVQPELCEWHLGMIEKEPPRVCTLCGRDRHGYKLKGTLCRYCAGEAE